AELRRFAPPQIGFNYLGRFSAANDAWSAADTGDLDWAASAMPLAHCVEVNARTAEDNEGAALIATWTWAPALFSEDEVSELARGWFRVLEGFEQHVSKSGAGGHSPCDFPLVELSQETIERLEIANPQLEDV